MMAPDTLRPPPDAGRSDVAAPVVPRTLVDLFYPGFYLLFLLRAGGVASDPARFRERLKAFLAEVDGGARRLDVPADDLHQAKFAFCALVDEVVLMSPGRIRDTWERKPLQLELFGEHMAGERFFEALERLRGEGAGRLQALEVFHLCLLLGFQGRHAVEGREKLGWLSARLGDEIASIRGRRAPFAPHWAPPDKVVHRLRREWPLWAIVGLLATLALGAFAGLRWQLDRQTDADLAGYADVVRLAPQPAYVTITLP